MSLSLCNKWEPGWKDNLPFTGCKEGHLSHAFSIGIQRCTTAPSLFKMSPQQSLPHLFMLKHNTNQFFINFFKPSFPLFI